MDSYADAILGAQRHGGQRFDDVAGDEFKMKLLLDHGEQERRLKHGECGADTDSGSAAEREIGEARNFSGTDRVFTPALGIEGIGIGEEALVALRQGLKNENVGSGPTLRHQF
jgi:hypothetical protein